MAPLGQARWGGWDRPDGVSVLRELHPLGRTCLNRRRKAMPMAKEAEFKARVSLKSQRRLSRGGDRRFSSLSVCESIPFSPLPPEMVL